MHGIQTVHICNFKSCADLSIRLSDFSPLVGFNNAGKSNIMDAILWAIKPSSLKEDDFFDSDAEISVTMKVGGLSEDILAGVEEGHRKRIAEYCTDESITIKRTQAAPGVSATKISLHILDENGDWKLNPTGIPPAIKALFPEPIVVGAMENATEDVSKSKTTTTIGKLIAEVVRPIEENHGQALSQALAEIKHRLEADGEDRAEELVEIDVGANKHLEELFPGLRIQVHVPPPELNEILKSGTLKVSETGSDAVRDISALGHGAQRSIQMALIRYLAEIKKPQDSQVRTILFIDEPELYLHPHGIEKVRVALKGLSRSGYQIIFATHSPLMITKEDVANTSVVFKDELKQTKCRARITDKVKELVVEEETQTDILFEFSNLSQVLFNNRILIAEGKTETSIIPDVYESLCNNSMASNRFGLVSPNGSGGIPGCEKILRAMGMKTYSLVDLDHCFRNADKLDPAIRESADFSRAKEIVEEQSGPLDYDVAEDGFPRKSNGRSSAQHLERLVSDVTEFAEIVERFHNTLKVEGIWLWTKGTVETHLGIQGKTTRARSIFLDNLSNHGPENTISDFSTLETFVNWLND